VLDRTREHTSLHAALFSVVMIEINRVREEIQARFILWSSALKKEMVCSAECSY
jgi:hypothetical protein